MKKWIVKPVRRKDLVKWGVFALIVCLNAAALAQSTDNGISKANEEVTKAFNKGITLMYAVGGVLGLIGAVKVYQKWNSGDPDTSKVAAAWFGSCIFLVVVVTVIKSFFNLN
jgi:hypothetical protein